MKNLRTNLISTKVSENSLQCTQSLANRSRKKTQYFLLALFGSLLAQRLIHQLHELSSSKILSVVLSFLALRKQVIRSVINYLFVKAQRMFKVFALKKRHN